MIKNSRKEGLNTQRIFFVLLKTVVFGYLVTIVMLSIMALLMYKFDLSDSIVSLGVIITMVISTFISGFLTARTINIL